MIAKYNAAAAAFITLTNLKVGDKVKVLYKAESYQWGWDAVWNDREYGYHTKMSDFIGEESTVTEIYRNMIQLSIGMDRFYFPFYVIQPILPVLPDPIYLNEDEDYQAKFEANGDIKVGSIDIPFDVLENIYNQAKTIQ